MLQVWRQPVPGNRVCDPPYCGEAPAVSYVESNKTNPFVVLFAWSEFWLCFFFTGLYTAPSRIVTFRAPLPQESIVNCSQPPTFQPRIYLGCFMRKGVSLTEQAFTLCELCVNCCKSTADS